MCSILDVHFISQQIYLPHRMGFLVKVFQTADYITLYNVYISIQSISITRFGPWVGRFFLQANYSREDKLNGAPGLFIPTYEQTAEFSIQDTSDIFGEAYAAAKLLFGDGNVEDVLEDMNTAQTIPLTG